VTIASEACGEAAGRWEGGFIMADKSKGVDGKKKRKKKPPELKESKPR
jgi:hypothetical protein